MTLNAFTPRGLLVLVMSLLVTGCASTSGGDQATTTDRLTIPPDLSQERIGNVPDLTGSRSSTLSEFTADGGRASSLLPEPPGMRVQRSGSVRWLEINAAPEQVWSWLGEFLEEHDVDVVRRAQALGIIETDWLPRPLGMSGGIFLPIPADTDAAVREQYVFRLEPGLRGQRSELYVAHRRALQVGEGDDEPHWQPSEGEATREVEALRSFMVYLGMNDAMAARAAGEAEATSSLSELETGEDGTVSLLINESYLQAWRRTGLALDRAGFTVDERDRAAGRYVVRYDPGAESERQQGDFFSWLAFWRDQEPALEPGNYAIRARSESGSTRLTVESEDGEAVPTALSERLLVLIDEQLR